MFLFRSIHSENQIDKGKKQCIFAAVKDNHYKCSSDEVIVNVVWGMAKRHPMTKRQNTCYWYTFVEKRRIRCLSKHVLVEWINADFRLLRGNLLCYSDNINAGAIFYYFFTYWPLVKKVCNSAHCESQFSCVSDFCLNAPSNIYLQLFHIIFYRR